MTQMDVNPGYHKEVFVHTHESECNEVREILTWNTKAIKLPWVTLGQSLPNLKSRRADSEVFICL